MSGAEIIAAVGIAASLLQLIDFGTKLGSRLAEFSVEAKEVPKAFQHTSIQLPLIIDTLKRKQVQAENGNLNEATLKALLPVINDCQKQVEMLDEILTKICPTPEDSRWRRRQKALYSLSQEKKVQAIAANIERYIPSLTYHQSVTGAVAATPAAPISSSKTHFMIPIHWSDDFTGRAEILTQLKGKLCLPGRHCRATLIRLGGIGKTRIALEYALKYRSSNAMSVFWIHACTAARVEKSCLEIAKMSAIPGVEDVRTDKVTLVKTWFEGKDSGNWVSPMVLCGR